jgi:predicted HicB family RNase H-like nuclease
MAKKRASKTSDVSFITIRIDPSLHMRLSKAAIDSERSLNSEIAHRLSLSFLPNRESPEFAQVDRSAIGAT